MKNIFKASTLLLVMSIFIILSSSCKKDDKTNLGYGLNNTGHILFQYDHINFAWGYQNCGWFIDDEGKVKGYNLPGKWASADNEGYIKEDSLEFNYNKTDTLLYTIEKSELLANAKLIEKTIYGKLTNETHIAYDAGGACLYCFYYDKLKNVYKIVFLAETGDFEKHDTDSSAIELTKWLIGIGEKTHHFFWLEPELLNK